MDIWIFHVNHVLTSYENVSGFDSGSCSTMSPMSGSSCG